MTTPPTNLSFEDTRLPKHPAIEQAFSELRRLDADDAFTTRGVKIARLIAEHSTSKDPDAIAAGLLVPLASDHGPVLLAKAELPGRIPEIIQTMFDFGALALNDEPSEEFYKSLDPAVRSVILASSARMFDVTAQDMQDIKASKSEPLAEKQNETDYLSHTLRSLRNFTAMVTRVETEETALVAKCQKALRHIESALAGAAEAPPAAKSRKNDFKP